MPSQLEIVDWLDAAFKQMQEFDRHLLTNTGMERPLAHRLAHYLEISNSLWHVDCDYGKLGDRPKYLSPEKIPRLAKKLVRPDVIVHIRGSDGTNLLAIELKQNPTPKQRAKDIAKLVKYRSILRYEYAVFITNITATGSLFHKFVS